MLTRQQPGEAGDMQRSKQAKAVNVDKGVLLVRYATSDSAGRPPRVEIAVNPRHRRHIELISNPERDDGVLWQPGACLVVRAKRAGQLFVEVTPSEAGGSSAATVKIETLTQGQPEVEAVDRTAVDMDFDIGAFNILGHVAGIGDVYVRADEWIAGPNAPARIEGLSIVWPDKPEAIDIFYSVKLARPHAISGRRMASGDFAGTRGRALPIVGVTLELAGPGASGFRLVGEAAFLGAPVMRMSGKQISASGPTGREPLVGLKLRLDEVGPALVPQIPIGKRRRPSDEVRIFRAAGAGRRASQELEPLLGSGQSHLA
jgi:hypothetical protein